jgi:hypothetical protein
MAASCAARLLVEGGRPVEALPWCRAALRASLGAGLRDNAFVLEVYGAALGLAGDHVAALPVFGAVEAQGGLLARMTQELGKPAADRARAEGARTTMAVFIEA